MTTLEKLATLEFYMVGSTVLEDISKKFMATTYYQALEDFGHRLDIPYEEQGFEVLYAPTIEAAIDKAYEVEQKLKEDEN